MVLGMLSQHYVDYVDYVGCTLPENVLRTRALLIMSIVGQLLGNIAYPRPYGPRYVCRTMLFNSAPKIDITDIVNKAQV